ncbi:MAG: hypothetical protein F4Y08_10580 [Caldilineaceae bacterium SB0662_bin_9]|uniref:Uncharacterized protein n=1 Tax=Caldilineaceae bacterium SB0662_bin_9 TaxID=2605258 RepID=A0A6B1DVS3_9CHLR|nr:hypothetical protein [Caldilineaceae bacterium]MYD90763.1 hypothetical protein [Caldilineaceae bacterium SB0662_bin_9]
MAAIPPPVPQFTCDDLLQLKPSLQAYLECFQPLFPRRDQGTSFLAYAEGLMPCSRSKPGGGGWRLLHPPWSFRGCNPALLYQERSCPKPAGFEKRNQGLPSSQGQEKREPVRSRANRQVGLMRTGAGRTE